MDIAPSADRRGPSRSEILAEQGKPVVLPLCGKPPERKAVGAAGRGMQKNANAVL